ncbi:PulJ/GspJ family protein [Pilimelia columellifera]|uniref:Prepilin-type N-terminal cleavage/methylation domain-containing protein n=1 Tax=Pilimelia columellifera subsp. columellifera TaxID=706583 RepID=A0ABN3NQK9_9ACTN
MTGRPNATRRRGAGGDLAPDAGLTLIEILVAFGIMSVVLTIFTTGLVGLQRSLRVSEALAQAQTQVGQAFARLDAEIRYAGAVRAVSLTDAGGATFPVLEWLTTAGRVSRCYRLWLYDGQLYHRTWNSAGSPGDTPPPRVLAAGLGDAAEPFVVDPGPADSDAPLKVTVSVVATAGGVGQSRERQLHQTFVLPNTTLGTRGASMDNCEDSAVTP